MFFPRVHFHLIRRGLNCPPFLQEGDIGTDHFDSRAKTLAIGPRDVLTVQFAQMPLYNKLRNPV